jgi:hypothetical protein
MPVRFLKNASELADVSMESPLPVQASRARLQLRPADTLLVATTYRRHHRRPRLARQYRRRTAHA